jgi:cytochrome c-type biogenesis protein CcmF
MPMTEADIDAGITARPLRLDGRAGRGGAWGVRVYHKPFVDWIWGGCVLMALGGFLALATAATASHVRRESVPAGAVPPGLSA